jgi:hypothetical protein
VEDVKEGGLTFFSHADYKQWRGDAGPSVLWLEGKPGSGKSTLSKLMIHKLEEERSNLIPRQSNLSHNNLQNGKEIWTFNNPKDISTIIARFYYSFRGGNTQSSHELMLRSIVYQIWKENSRLFPLLRDRYRELKRSSDAREKQPLWSYDELKSALQSLHRIEFDLNLFIVVDGMDESDNDKRADVLNFLPSLAVLDTSCITKIFIASRPEIDIGSQLLKVPHHIKLQEVNEKDIIMVVERWIERMESERGCKRETFSTTKEYITKHSSGVFMWVMLVLRDIEQCVVKGWYSIAVLDERVKGLPRELGGKDGFYRAMIESLIENCKEDTAQKERGRRIFAWITFVKRPLSVLELQDALATPQSESTNFSSYRLEDHRPLQLDQGILSSCGGLVEVSITILLSTS